MHELKASIQESLTKSATKVVDGYFNSSTDLKNVHQQLFNSLDKNMKHNVTEVYVTHTSTKSEYAPESKLTHSSKVKYGSKMKLTGQSGYQYSMAQEIIEALTNTGLKTETFIDALRPYIPEEFSIIVYREDGRIHSVEFAPGRKTIQKSYEELSLSEWMSTPFEMNKSDIKFVHNVLKRTKRLRDRNSKAYLKLVHSDPSLASKALFVLELLKAQKKDHVIKEAFRELFNKELSEQELFK